MRTVQSLRTLALLLCVVGGCAGTTADGRPLGEQMPDDGGP